MWFWVSCGDGGVGVGIRWELIQARTIGSLRKEHGYDKGNAKDM